MVVFHRSMADWRGSVCPRYLCIMLYVNLIKCSDLPEIYGQLEEGVGSVCTGVVVCHRSLVDWRRGWGQSVMKLSQCSGLL